MKKEIWVDDYGFAKIPFSLLQEIGLKHEPKIGFDNYKIYAEVDKKIIELL